MFTKINHLAIISENYTTSAKFYEVMFGMSTSAGTRSERAMTVGDGYLGLNINPRSTGRPARLDHFGVEVEDVERVFAALRRNVRLIVRLPASLRTIPTVTFSTSRKRT